MTIILVLKHLRQNYIAREEHLEKVSVLERRYLKTKRYRDEEESQIRLNIAREGFLRSQEYLRQLLKEKDGGPLSRVCAR